MDDAHVGGPVLAVGSHGAITASATAGVALFTRCPPVHTVLLGTAKLEVAGSVRTTRSLALPAHTPHTIHALEGPFAAVAYLDARRFRFEDVEQLAERWRGFEPGHDDLREAYGDCLAIPRRRVDARVLRALEALETDLTVAETARRIALSESRLTHLTSETLGAPPSAWRAWFKLRRALGEVMFGGATLTEAAHRAGFADSAHLTRTCKQRMGVLPSRMMPRVVHTME